MNKRLRPAYTPEEIARIYRHPYDHAKWDEHRRRTLVTIAMGKMLVMDDRDPSIADLSCGDAEIARSISDYPGSYPILGDYTHTQPIHGPIEETIHQIPNVDLFILSETLEHLDDPDAVLMAIRGKARRLLLSTPSHESWEEDDNEEHYWQWGTGDMRLMLSRNGWQGDHLIELGGPDWFYRYQIWGCS